MRRVALTQAAVGVDQELGHQKQRDTFGAGRGIRQLGQHQVDNVFGQVLLAAGNEDLGAADAVTAIGGGFRPGADDPEVGAGMRFGQAHGAGPLAAVQRRQVSGLEVVTGVGIEGQAATCAQRRVEAEAAVGGVEHFFELHREHFRHAQATVLGVAGKADPAAFTVGLPGLGKAIRGTYLTGVKGYALFIATAVERGDQLAGDFRRFFEDGIGGIGVHPIAQRRQACPQGRALEHFMKDKAHVAQWSIEFRHAGSRCQRGIRAPWPSRVTDTSGSCRWRFSAVH
ncbi:hypothetical protein D3C81_1255410 [compost metagenome]